MSGGALFDYSYPDFESADGRWRDEEMDELYHDLFCGSDFSVRGYGGLAQTLDFWLSRDVSEKRYRDAVRDFKNKWFNKVPSNRVEFYRRKIREYADRCASELTGMWEEDMLDRD